jgi:hypothetical protein
VNRDTHLIYEAYDLPPDPPPIEYSIDGQGQHQGEAEWDVDALHVFWFNRYNWLQFNKNDWARMPGVLLGNYPLLPNFDDEWARSRAEWKKYEEIVKGRK